MHKFYVNPSSTANLKVPFFTLEYREWNDYNRRTNFYLSYYDENKDGHYLGLVKIMHENEFNTLSVIDRNFQELPETFCSLGTSITFYQTLYDLLGQESFEEYLNSLNDIAFLNAIRVKFEFHQSFIKSLIRYSEAEKAFYEARKIIYNVDFQRNFTFTYKCMLPHTESEHKVDFNFGDNPELPNRIIALIGKNGTGKTQFLAQFALDLSGQSKSFSKEERFVPHRPLFSKVITISYSAFDKFSRPKKDKSFSYKYCGFKGEDGRLLSGSKVIENYKESVKLIIELGRRKAWHNAIAIILDKDAADRFEEEIFENSNFDILDNKSSQILSSGQSFLMYVITEILANITENSVLLFDEPEMHLHPNAIANFVRMLEKILNRFESYSIVATHSPIILQEIPARYVNVFERQGNVPMVYKLGKESFGESIDVLTMSIFKTIEVEDNYKTILKSLSKEYSYKDVLSLFDRGLSLNAKTYLLSQYEDPKSEINA